VANSPRRRGDDHRAGVACRLTQPEPGPAQTHDYRYRRRRRNRCCAKISCRCWAATWPELDIVAVCEGRRVALEAISAHCPDVASSTSGCPA
jgi:hypothetical protein